MSSSGTKKTIFQLQVQGDQEVVNKFKQVATSMQQLGPALAKAATETTKAGNALKTTGQAATQSSSGLKSYSGALTSLGSANNQAKTGVDAFTGSLGTFNKTNTATVGGLTDTNTVAKGLVPTMGTLGNEGTKTQSKMQKLTDVFQGNKGLIFSTTMLSSGIVEAIGMYQGWQDASEKLTAAKEKEADLLERGMEGTKEYGEAVNEVADAQRGYNFITRFTIQSFADLIPMSLMLTSSLLGMVGNVGGLTAAKTKLAAAGTKLVGVLQSIGTALLTFTTRHPILALLTLAAAAVIALIKNFWGFRDAVNGVGVALGQIIPQLKGALEWLGFQGNAALDTADSYLTYGNVAMAATSDVEKQVLKTGDATTLSYTQQIELMAKMGEESGTLAVSLGAHLKQQQQDEEAHNIKYKQFAEAMTTGNEDIMQSLGLTADEFADFSKRFQEETAALDETWGTAVESILENWDKVNSGFGDSVNSTVGEIVKLEGKITELTQQQWELDDKKELKKNREEIAKNQAKIDELRGVTGSSFESMGAMYEVFGNIGVANLGQKLSPAMEEAGRDFITLGEQAKQGLDSIQLGILSQDFQGAINGLSTAIDGVPARYQGNFAEIDAIIGNSSLNWRQKVAQITADFGSLEGAFQPLIVGAYELSRADAALAAEFDELSVAARSNMTNMNQAEGAWNKFFASLSPAQKALPMIEDLIARVNAGTITHAEALQEAEAAGAAWSKTLGKDVLTSIKNVEKSFIDLGDGTSAMVANVNGSMVNLGRVSNTELGNMSNDLGGVQTSMGDTASAAKTDLENEATAAVGVFGKDGKFHFGTVVLGANNVIEVFKAVDIYADKYVSKGAGGKVATFATTMGTTGKTIKTETTGWGADFESFKTKAISVIDSIAERIKGTNIFNLLPSLGKAEGAEDGGQIPVMPTGQKVDYDITPAISKLDQLKAYVTQTTTQISAMFLTMGQSIKLTLSQIPPAAQMATSQISAAFVTMEASIKGTVLRISTTFTTMFTPLPGLAMTATSQVSVAFITMMTSIQGTLTQIAALFPTTFATLPTLAMEATSQTSAAFVTMLASIKGTITQVIAQITTLQGALSTLSTSTAAYMKSMSANTASWGVASITALSNVSKNALVTQKSLSTLSTSVAAYTKSMTAAIKSFASSTVSAFNSIISAAKKLVSALNSVAAAAKKAAAAKSAAGMQHGGMFIAGGGARGQHGYSGIVDQPMKFKGVRVGEGFAPELVTVTPLTRGTGNHGGPTLGGGGGGGKQPIINNITVVLDGRVIQRFVEKTALNNIGLQI